jgi:SAM-dependent methyltransferase
MVNLYRESWRLYKAHSERCHEDHAYYLDFCKGFKSLEIFAGYGRVTNFLAANKVDIAAVELEPEFAKFIEITKDKNHVADVLHFEAPEAFQRVMAAYNSFCLLTREEDIKKFFQQINSWLVKGGRASLSYYHPDYWINNQEDHFEYEGQRIRYVAKNDASKRKQKRGVWIDEYHIGDQKIQFEYPIRVYENKEDLLPFLAGTDLVIVDIVQDYRNKNISDPGWVEYVLQKS